ncbi:flagellar motor switch protein FliN [Edwardsiella ictaluri]|uniref:Flagellar motor switch protein FliN n=2 Tax=Edwardsiella ictaluri TaxID=67780 RepID=C5BAB9_EDWI9|nr:flagellar motor switch protein FliN [Edwardsiella ictaluri]ACR69599.1 flagellar motor switch protein FliN, putative [Edwardsiella ictaluri 93-146]ARD38710.1 flagellar motor switch protein FliN [Edwardsiella ictaluri]AVZ83407.1 flagellar motor switch protein FliN [Edwardsiella ictaluri]EKS7762982.1 flagellar motor switch protein FliN [Edwardsiella ictaluri]EKS7769894.1 flagellar motor switch protein FliN [Edwardsiella ictaluri]
MSDANKPSADAQDDAADLWAEAMGEQQTAAQNNGDIFQNLDETPTLSVGSGQDIDLIMDIPVKLTVELGRTKMTIKELLRLSQGSVVALDGLAGEPLDVLINGYLIAQGEVVVVNDKFGVRITDIITPSERMRRLSR